MLNRSSLYNYKSVDVRSVEKITFNNVNMTIWVDTDGVQWLELQEIQNACGYPAFHHSMNGAEYMKPSMYNMVYRITDDITSICRLISNRYLVISLDSLKRCVDSYIHNTKYITKMRELINTIDGYVVDNTLNTYVKMRIQHLQEIRHNIDTEIKYLKKLL